MIEVNTIEFTDEVINACAAALWEKHNGPRKANKKQRLHLFKLDRNEMEIDFHMFHHSIVNAYRRIILAEVPTMAIDRVHRYHNTSVIQDEVLTHRIGLIPMDIPAKYFSFRDEVPKPEINEEEQQEKAAKFLLHVKCRGGNDILKPGQVLVDKNVTSAHLMWQPIGGQTSVFVDRSLGPVKEVNKLASEIAHLHTSDVLLAKLAPGQEIHYEAFAFKGISSDHAKFQPGQAWYRFMNKITLNRKVTGEEAKVLQSLFSPGVISIKKNYKGEGEAVVENPRIDSCSRNVFYHPDLKTAVKLGKDTTHCIFHVESMSAMPAWEILEAAMDVLIDKCDTLMQSLEETITM